MAQEGWNYLSLCAGDLEEEYRPGTTGEGMSDDLVARLRAASRSPIPSVLLVSEAADEIIALRERVKIRDEQIADLEDELRHAGDMSFEDAQR